MTTGPQDPAAAGRDRLRAGHADREQVVEALKDAFVQGRLTRDELDARVAQLLASRTYAELAALTADIPPAPAAAGPARPPTPARRWPLVRAAAGSGGCLVIAAAAFWGATILDPGPPAPSPDHYWAPLMLLIVLAAVLAALGILANGVVTSWEQRRSRRRLPPRPGPDGHALGGERRGGTGHGPVPPGPHPRPDQARPDQARPDQARPDQARADLRAHKSPQHRQHIPARAGRAPRGVRPEPGAV